MKSLNKYLFFIFAEEGDMKRRFEPSEFSNLDPNQMMNLISPPRKITIEDPDDVINHCLRFATKCGDLRTVRLLVEGGADIDTTTNVDEDDEYDNDDTPLMIAAGENYLDIAKYLLGKGADTEGTDTVERTALFVACAGNHIDMVKLLLENKADPNVSDDEGTTPLEIAMDRGNTEMITLLLKSGAKQKPLSQN